MADPVAPKQAGLIQRLVAKGITSMSPTERIDMLKDAAAASGAELAKAEEILRGAESETHHVEDQWTGAPDDPLKTNRTGGAGSPPEAGGSANIGTPQSASGAGAERMVREYSQFATQSGVQAATERLGRQLESMRGAVKAIMSAVNAQGTRLDTLSSALPTSEAFSAALSKAITKAAKQAVVKAERKALRKAIRKGKSETEDEKKQEKKEHDWPSAKAEVIKAVDDESESDEPESDEDKEKAKAAAFLRVMAKQRLQLAKARLLKATAKAAAGNQRVAARHQAYARQHLAKAQAHYESARALWPNSPQLPVVAKSLASFAKALPKPPSKNQDHWPDSGNKPAGSEKAASGAAPAAPAESGVSKAELGAIVARIEAANQGIGMFQADMAKFMAAIGGQSRGSGLPPAVELARDQPDTMIAKSASIEEMREQGVVSDAEADSALDILTIQLPQVAQGRLDERIVRSRIERMTPPLRQIFSKDAA